MLIHLKKKTMKQNQTQNNQKAFTFFPKGIKICLFNSNQIFFSQMMFKEILS